MVSTTRNQIREFLQGIASGMGVDSFTDQESLVENGVVQSLTIFRLVSFLEDAFGLRIADVEISSENFETVEKIEQFVASKTKK